MNTASFAAVAPSSPSPLTLDKTRNYAKSDRVTFDLEDGSGFTISSASPYFQVWNALSLRSRRSGQPLYVEKRGDEAVRLLSSKRRHILSIAEPEANKAEITFAVSNAVTFIDKDAPNAADLLRSAEEAMTNNTLVEFVYQPSSGKILNLRAARALRDKEPVVSDVASLAETTKGLETDPVDHATASQLFNLCADLAYVPFFYPNDCCAYRAWEMHHVLRRSGFACNKLFLYPKITSATGANGETKIEHGRLKAKTDNHPKGFVRWKYHVAPVIYVRQNNGDPKPYVIDPALFDRIETQQAWMSVQPDEAGNSDERKHKETPGTVFYRTPRPYSPYKSPDIEQNRCDLTPVEDKEDGQAYKKEADVVKKEFEIHYAEKLDLYIVS